MSVHRKDDLYYLVTVELGGDANHSSDKTERMNKNDEPSYLCRNCKLSQTERVSAWILDLNPHRSGGGSSPGYRRHNRSGAVWAVLYGGFGGFMYYISLHRCRRICSH
jgi:hypothetical protein